MNDRKRQKFLIDKKLSYIFSSDVKNGAINVSSIGDKFTVQLYNPLYIPPNALNVELKVIQSQLWFNTPNISADLNNNIIYYNNGTTNKTITIPKGLYNINDINNLLQREFINNGDPADLFALIGDNATQKVFISFSVVGASIDFTQPDTPRVIFGFDSVIVGPSTIVGQQFEAQNVAGFNTVNSYLMHGNIISDGIPTNEISTATLVNVPINDTPVGFQINYAPFNPITVDANELIGKSKTDLVFYLTNERNEPVDTLGESWSLTIEISYKIPV